MPEMHLRQPGFTYSACGPFTKNRERIQKFKERGDSRYIYQKDFSTSYGIWLMEILRICLEEKVLIIICVIKHFIMLKIQNMMDIKNFFRWFIFFFACR